MCVRTQLLRHWHEPITQDEWSSSLHAISYHYYTKAPLIAWDPAHLRDAARLPRELLDALNTFRGLLDRKLSPSRQRTSISLDEWGFGPPWAVTKWGAAHGMYGAVALATLVNHASRLHLVAANYFQPINEGFLTVHPHNTTLTPMGEAVTMLARHQGHQLLRVASVTEEQLDAADLSLLASTDASTGKILVTIINCNAAVGVRVRLPLAGKPTSQAAHPGAGSSGLNAAVRRLVGTATILKATDVVPLMSELYGGAGQFLPEQPLSTAMEHFDGQKLVAVDVAPFSIVQVQMQS